MHINFEVEEGHEAFSLLIPAFAECEEEIAETSEDEQERQEVAESVCV
jgi:hypothetical protein